MFVANIIFYLFGYFISGCLAVHSVDMNIVAVPSVYIILLHVASDVHYAALTCLSFCLCFVDAGKRILILK